MEATSRPWVFATSLPVARGRDTYLAENGFSEDEYDLPSVKVNYAGILLRVPNPPSRRRAIRLHDLHHVATGFGTDPIGEAEISAWEMRNGLRSLGFYVGGIVLSGAIMGLLLAPRRTLAAYRAAGHGNSLFSLVGGPNYEELLSMNVGELRALLGIPEHGLAAHVPGLHAAAPARGESSHVAQASR